MVVLKNTHATLHAQGSQTPQRGCGLRVLPGGASEFPSFESLLKSREVEDPINIHVHRRLAYWFVKAVHRTCITPNMVTFLAMFVGITAGAMFIWGTPGAMVAGGLLVWTSAILDGADGFLARATNTQSQFGRALDGAADTVVAVFTLFPVVYHMWAKGDGALTVTVAFVAIATTVLQLRLYDHYKEMYLRSTRTDGRVDGGDVDALAKDKATIREQPFFVRWAVNVVLIPYTRSQREWIERTNPHHSALESVRTGGPERAAIHRKHNRHVMQLWAMLSLAPHAYLMSTFAVFDRVDAYVWMRLTVMNALFVVAILWQREVTRRTLRELDALGREDSAAADRTAIAA
jgi:phosphatidylglycerophosphate synthase